MIAFSLQALTLAALALVAGCGEDVPTGPPDHGELHDLAVPATGVTLTVGGVTQPLDAYYSIFIEPLEMPGVPMGVELVVTFIDQKFQCMQTATGLDAISFGFLARLPGVTSMSILGRAGPHLGPISTGTGYAELGAVDDRFVDWDGGTVIVGQGGMVRGTVHFQSGDIRIDGPFVAPHCSALDVVAAP